LNIGCSICQDRRPSRTPPRTGENVACPWATPSPDRRRRVRLRAARARRGVRRRAGAVAGRGRPAAVADAASCSLATRLRADEDGRAAAARRPGRAADRHRRRAGAGDSATSLRDMAIRAGVPPEKIRMEQVSRSTHGAMEAVRPILEDERIRSVAVVTSPYHQRRAVWTARRTLRAWRSSAGPRIRWLEAGRLVEDALGPTDRPWGVREAGVLRPAGVGVTTARGQKPSTE